MVVFKVGCCGFPVSRSRYFKTHSLVEIQQTFYKLPSKKTLVRWRNEAPENFEFTIKAWQVITHSPSSPTWKKSGIKVPDELKDKYGYLRPTKENFEAWNMVEEAAEILGAKIIVVQTPPSFNYTDENFNNAIEFFSRVAKKTEFIIAWEPRGTWLNNLEKIREIIEKTGIIHCIDPFIKDPAVIGHTVYLRLHGRGKRWPNYKYKYTDEDLVELKKKIFRYGSVGAKEVYILFNNVYMYNDSLKFKKLLSIED